MVENSNYIPDANGNTPDIMPQVPPLDVVRRHGSGVYADDLIHNADDDKKPDFLQDDDWFGTDISDTLLDVTKERVKPNFLLSSNGIPFAELGDIMCITGQAGNGKTALLSIFMGAVLKGQIGCIRYELSANIPKPRIIYIDTEQGERHSMRISDRISTMAGWDKHHQSEQFEVRRLRNITATVERWRAILQIVYEASMQEIKPIVIVIDNLQDTIDNPNDLEECKEHIYKCMALATCYNVSLWLVIHQNPNADLKGNVYAKMMGHLGSYAVMKATNVWCCQKDKDATPPCFTVTQTKARDKDVMAIKFHIEDDPTNKIDIPVPIEPPKPDAPKDPEQVKAERIKETFERFALCEIPPNGMSETELREALGKGYQSNKSNGRFYVETTLLMEAGHMTKEKGRYYLWQNPDTKPKQTNLQFDGEQRTSTPEPDGNGQPT